MPQLNYKTAGSIHLFQIYGQLTPDKITLERKYLWDIIRIDWKEVFVTWNGTIIQLPILVKIPLRDKYRQGMSWYALDNIEYLLPPLCLGGQKFNCRKWQAT